MSNRPVEFWGRLYQGKEKRDIKNMDFSIDDLKQLGDLKNTPIWLEHDARQGNIGKIIKSWVDPRDGWLWIHGCLNSPEEIGAEFHAEIKQKLVNGQLPDLSIHWVGEADSATDVVEPTSKVVIEASLTKQGFFKGTNLLSVAASANSSKKTKHFRASYHLTLEPPKNTTKQVGFAMSQDLQTIIADIKKRHGVDITPEQARHIAPDGTGIDGALLVLNKLTELSEKKEQAMSAKEMEILNRSRMEQEEREELEKLRQWREQAEKSYAEEQGKIADDMFSVIANRVPEDRKGAIQEQLKTAASRSDYAQFWDLVKLFGQSAAENGKLATDYSKQIARSKKEYQDLMKDRESMMEQAGATQTVEVQNSMYSAKRGIDKDAQNSQAKKTKNEAPTKPVEQAASAEVARANYYFSKAIGVNSRNDEFSSALDKLANETKLPIGVPIVDWSHYRGYNRGPTYDKNGFIPFGAH
jgi:hypothetical protein